MFLTSCNENQMIQTGKLRLNSAIELEILLHLPPCLLKFEREIQEMIQALYLLIRRTWPAAETFLPHWGPFASQFWGGLDSSETPHHLERALGYSLSLSYLQTIFSAPGWLKETLNPALLVPSWSLSEWFRFSEQCGDGGESLFCHTAWPTAKLQVLLHPRGQNGTNDYEHWPTPRPTAVSWHCYPRSPAPVLSLGIVPHILRFTRWSSVFLGRSSKTHKNEVFLITNKMPWSARDDGLRGPRKGENTAHGCENALRSLSQLLVALWPWASHFTCLGKRRWGDEPRPEILTLVESVCSCGQSFI